MTRKVLAGLWLLLTISCAPLDKPAETKLSRPSPDTIRFETRDVLMRWYDETYKSYYGLKGPVERLDIHVVRTRTGEPASDSWRLWFNPQGRLLRKQRLVDESQPEFATFYEYGQPNHSLRRITSSLDKKPWRTSEFVYAGDQLVRVEYADHTSAERFRVKRDRTTTAAGWFDIETPVEKIDMPRYSEFNREGELVWSSKGDINNGLGEVYFIRTVDAVTSSSVVNQNTSKMAGRGGYRYHYYDNGLLKSVESYNAHNQRLFHVTDYRYDDLWLLVGENKQVKDSSVFNQVIQEQVNYDYLVIDAHGNWLQRTLRYSAGHQKEEYKEQRTIVYFDRTAAAP